MSEIKSIRFPPPVADEMIRAILEGRKTVTRRVVKLHSQNEIFFGMKYSYAQYAVFSKGKSTGCECIRTLYRPGNILYVRETWEKAWKNRSEFEYIYKANVSTPDPMPIKWHPSTSMPREAARLFLRVTDVRVERLHDMTMGDILVEGVVPQDVTGGQWQQWARDYMCPVWDSTIKKPTDRALYGWAANPWVWVIEFERCGKPKEDTPC